MMQYSLLDRRPEETCLQLLHGNNISVLARGSVAGGILVNKPAKPYLNYNATEVTNAAMAIKKISSKERTPAQTAIQFVLKNPSVTSALVGIRTMEQLTDAVNAGTSPELSKDEMEILKASVPVNYYTDHRQCKYNFIPPETSILWPLDFTLNLRNIRRQLLPQYLSARPTLPRAVIEAIIAFL